MGKYIRVTNMEEDFGMFVTLIRYFSIGGKYLDLRKMEQVQHKYECALFHSIAYFLIFSNSLLFTHVTHADVTI